MKLFALGAVLMACLAFAQDRTRNTPSEQNGAYVLHYVSTHIYNGQQKTFFFSRTLDRNGDDRAATIRLSGNDRLVSGSVSIQADEVIYHFDTGEIEARGHVSIRPITK